MFNRKKLIEIMEMKDISAYKLWKRSGVAQSTISNILNNENVNPTTNTLSKIADALDVSLNDLVDENDAPIEKINKIIEENKIKTIAAHFDGEKFTDEDVEDIEKFIKYVVAKRKNKL